MSKTLDAVKLLYRLETCPHFCDVTSIVLRDAADWLTAQGVRVVPREVTDKMWQDAVCTYQTLIGDDPHFVHAGHMKKALEAALTAHDTGGARE